MASMKVLVACEFSGIVRDAFIERGHDAISCDLLPSERPGPHIQGDVLPLLRQPWDLVIAHPPCEKLSAVNDCWTNNFSLPDWEEIFQQAIGFFSACQSANAPMVAVENPRMHRRARTIVGKADCEVHPYWFGSPYSKRTGFWLKNLPPLMATYYRSEHTPWVQWSSNYANELHYRHKGHSDPKKRAEFHPEMAAAMAQQWG